MSDPLPLDERVRELEQTVARLSARLDALEGFPAPAATRHETAPAAAPAGVAAADSLLPAEDRLAGLPALVGRTCLVLGGAFLVRALTEGGTLSNALGVGLGVLYALAWLFLADRAAAGGDHLSGAFHALASALIVYPLLFEAAARFSLLAPWPAAALLAGATALGLFVAWRRAFRTVAWITVLAALGDGVLLLFRTRAVAAFVCFLLTLAVGSLVLAYGRGWRGQRWVVAIALDAVVALLGALMLLERRPDWISAGPVLLAQLGLVAIYLGAFVLRLLVQEREVTPFAITQTLVALLVGFEGALTIGQGALRTGIAVSALALGAVLHAVLARRTEREVGQEQAFAYFSTLATFLAAESTRVLLPGAIYPALWVAAAVMLAVLALGAARPVLQMHAALLAAAGALGSGLALASVAALAFKAASPWPSLSPTALAVLLLALATAALLVRAGKREEPSPLATFSRITALVVASLGLLGALARGAGALLAAAPGDAASAGRLAVVRSAILALAALALAAWRSGGGKPELARLAWLVLAVGGLKLLAEDLRVGSAVHLVMSLACYGVALIVVPALLRRARSAARPPSEASPVR